MSFDCPYRNICSSTCPRTFTVCALHGFLKKINDQRQKYSKNPEDSQLIDELEAAYIEKWNEHAKSGGKGPAIGKAIEEWIRNKLEKQGKSVDRGKVKSRFGEFSVDVVIPSRVDPETILEIKKGIDTQYSLMLIGLIDQLINPAKIGLVTFHKPKENALRILENLKQNPEKRFDYFHIEDGWSNAITRLISFC